MPTSLRSSIFYGWYILAACFSLLFFQAGARFSFGLMFKPMMAQLGWDRASISLVFFLNMIFFALTLSIAGKLYDRWGPKWVILVSTLFLSVGYGSISFISTLWEFHLYYGILAAIGMGGASVFRVHRDDPNMNVILETITDNGSTSAMAQRYIPEITQGDKRILMIDGEPFPHALARIPAAGETRGNLAAGGTGKGVDLSDRDRWICRQVGPALREKGLLFAGLDVIGDYLTEINVTSPTCIRELDSLYDADIAGMLMDAISKQLARQYLEAT